MHSSESLQTIVPMQGLVEGELLGEALELDEAEEELLLVAEMEALGVPVGATLFDGEALADWQMHSSLSSVEEGPHTQVP